MKMRGCEAVDARDLTTRVGKVIERRAAMCAKANDDNIK
jgi:hypothetical protein